MRIALSRNEARRKAAEAKNQENLHWHRVLKRYSGHQIPHDANVDEWRECDEYCFLSDEALEVLIHSVNLRAERDAST